MSDLAELIAKLESASEGSRALDVAIQKTRVHPDVHPGHGEQTPRFTSSLDAALSLVPEGWCYEVAAGSRRDNARAEVWDHSCGMASHRYYARTGPLALCIASLRARSAA